MQRLFKAVIALVGLGCFGNSSILLASDSRSGPLGLGQGPVTPGEAVESNLFFAAL